MGKKLYVGNLPYSATEQALVEAFSQCGKVDSAKIITDRDTGRSKGFGFVELSNGTGDAFLHIGAVQSAGYETLPPGAKLQVQVTSSVKGQQVARILDVDLAGAGPARRGAGERVPRAPPRPRTGPPRVRRRPPASRARRRRRRVGPRSSVPSRIRPRRPHGDWSGSLARRTVRT